jgi:hypothetical protein
MSCVLTSGRTEIACRNNIGGIKAVNLFKFIEYPYNLISGVRGVTVDNFPETTLYRYETINANFSETINNDEEGISYSQSLTFTLFKSDLFTTEEINRATNIDLRYIVEFNDGSFKIGGLFNGARISNLDINSGGSKQDLNGYNITIESEEEYSAAFINMNNFASYLLLEDNFNILLETSSKITLE